MAHEHITRTYPNLLTSGFKVTSPDDIDYNCIAWAADETALWWWPDNQLVGYWPPSVPREETIYAFKKAYNTLGYVDCENHELEPGYEKIAIFATPDGIPQHAARQLESGHWTSKLGEWEDIEHFAVDGVSGKVYGTPVVFMKRPKKHST